LAEIDLERLAAGYAHRRGGEAARARAARTAKRAGLGPGAVAVDVGGGRGDHAAVFAAMGARAVVVDRSPAMAGAARRGEVAALVGDGRQLPLADGAADLLYFHVSLQYGGWEQMLGEAARVLRPGGLLAAWTFAPGHFRQSLLARWFPSIAPLDEARFPPPDLVEARLWALGMREVHQIAETESVSRCAGDWEAAVRGGFVSTLQLLPPGELESGLARFRKEHRDPGEVLQYRLWYRGVLGWKPGREGGGVPGGSR